MNKIKRYGISIPICLVFVNLLINSSYAQLDNFKTWTDKNNRFTIQYPEDWEVKDTDILLPKTIGYEGVVELTGPENTYLKITIKDLHQYLDTDTMTLKNTSLNQYVQMEFHNYCHSLIRSNEFPVDGNSGWKIECSLIGIYHMRVFTIANDKGIELHYSAYDQQIPKTFPLVNKMLESFQIIK